jgi:predicted cupin superfamily sugar epimerase
MTADQIIQLLNLKPHPEGGHYGETFRDAAEVGGRPASTAIYFLLMRGERCTGIASTLPKSGTITLARR